MKSCLLDFRSKSLEIVLNKYSIETTKHWGENRAAARYEGITSIRESGGRVTTSIYAYRRTTPERSDGRMKHYYHIRHPYA